MNIIKLLSLNLKQKKIKKIINLASKAYAEIEVYKRVISLYIFRVYMYVTFNIIF